MEMWEMAKFDPFLSLDCARVEGGGGLKLHTDWYGRWIDYGEEEESCNSGFDPRVE